MAAGLAARAWLWGAPAKVAGVALYGVMVYALVLVLTPRLRPWLAALIATAICFAIELFQLTPWPAALAPRHVLFRLVLGVHFDVWDLPMYAAGVLLAAAVHAGWSRAVGGQPLLVLVVLGLAITAIVVAADRGALPAALVDGIYQIPYGDKVGHFLLMAPLALLADLAAPGKRFGRLPAGSAVVALLVTAEEISQAFFPHRTFSGADLAASLAGVVVGARLARGYLAARAADATGSTSAPSTAERPR